MCISLLSIGGVPPTAGFHARLYILYALVDAQLIWLAVIFVASAPFIFYVCGKLWVRMYFRPTSTAPVEPSAELLVVLLLAATAALGFGFAPDILMETARSAAVSLM